MNKFLLLITCYILFAASGIKAFAEEPQTSQKKSIVKAIKKHSKGNTKQDINYYYQLKKQYPHKYNFTDEQALNNLGYLYLSQGKITDALDIFRLNTKEFPHSANAFDSLAEALLKNKDKKAALQNYQISLKINPENSHAAYEIDKLKYPTIDKSKFTKIYSKQQYLEDIDELAYRLTTVNPNVYKFISKQKFWQLIKEKKKLIQVTISPINYAQFIWEMSEIFASVSSGHTGLGYFNQQNEILPIKLRFPVETRLIDNKLYIIDGLINKNKITSGSEITEINGENVSKIMADIFKHLKSPGFIVSSKIDMFNGYNTALIAYSLGFPQTFEIKTKDNDNVIVLSPLKHYQSRPLIPAYQQCQKNLCLSTHKKIKTAIITIHSFNYYGSKFKTYKNFIDDSFKKIQNSDTVNLIIDLRLNNGGSSDTAILLLRYLAKKKFNYFARSQFNEKKGPFYPVKNRFTGKAYVLIDGNGASTTGHFVSLFKYLKLGTLIGEELGSNEFSTAGQNFFRSKNTEIFYTIGRYTYITATDSKNYTRGIMPDYYLTQSIEDYLNKIDTVLDYTLKLIKSNQH